jgi:hypothetical protein
MYTNQYRFNTRAGMSSTSISPSTTAAEQELPPTVRHALAEDLKAIARVLLAESPPTTDACLQQLRVAASRAQRSIDLATASAATSSKNTVEDLEARYSLTRERLELLVVDVKSADVCHANAKKALDTKRKAEAANADTTSTRKAEAVKADRQSARFVSSSWCTSAHSSSRRISSRSLIKRMSTRGIDPQPNTEPLQQATTDGLSAVVSISNVSSGRRKHAVRSANEGVAAMAHVAIREEPATSIRITRPLEFDPPMSRVAYAVGLSMLGVLLLSALYSAGVVGFIYGLGTALEGEAMTPSAKNRTGCLVCVPSAAVAFGIYMSVITWKLMLPHQRRQPVTMLRMLVSCWTFPLLAVVVVVVLVKNAERSVSGEFVGALLVLMATVTIVHQNSENLHRYRQDSLVRAIRTAVIIESAALNSEMTMAMATERQALETQQKSSWWRDLIRVVKIALPFLMVCVIAFVYVVGIFRLGNAAKAVVGGPEAVLLLALVVKMGGNKLQLLVIKNLPKVPLWLPNISVFSYVYTTALLVRMMLLSIPSPSTAIYFSLFNAAVELMERSWFFVGYISTGRKQLAELGDNNSTLLRAYVRRGQLRVIDGCNAAMVEYMTMLGAAAVVGFLDGSKALNLPTGENVALDRLGRVLGVQIAAELAVDTFVFALEAKGGLVPLQVQYWKSMSLDVVCIQFFVGITLTASVMGALLL